MSRTFTLEVNMKDKFDIQTLDIWQLDLDIATLETRIDHLARRARYYANKHNRDVSKFFDGPRFNELFSKLRELKRKKRKKCK